MVKSVSLSVSPFLSLCLSRLLVARSTPSRRTSSPRPESERPSSLPPETQIPSSSSSSSCSSSCCCSCWSRLRRVFLLLPLPLPLFVLCLPRPPLALVRAHTPVPIASPPTGIDCAWAPPVFARSPRHLAHVGLAPRLRRQPPTVFDNKPGVCPLKVELAEVELPRKLCIVRQGRPALAQRLSPRYSPCSPLPTAIPSQRAPRRELDRRHPPDRGDARGDAHDRALGAKDRRVQVAQAQLLLSLPCYGRVLKPVVLDRDERVGHAAELVCPPRARKSGRARERVGSVPRLFLGR